MQSAEHGISMRLVSSTITGNRDSPVRHVISVLISDRVGVLRDITSAVTALGGNIDGISQTVVQGYFTVILTASFSRPCDAETIRSAILKNFAPDEASVVVRPYERAGEAEPTVRGERYILTLNGNDRPGILKTVTSFLAEKGVNIEDWFVEFHAGHVVHVGEITLPAQLDIRQLQTELKRTASALGLESVLQHENIFRATNDIGPIRALLEGSANG